MHPEFAPVAFIAASSLILVLPWHWRARNIATLSIIAWLFVSNIIFAVDALIWGDNLRITATVWCDITTKFIIGANFALPAACLCLSMYLEKIASIRTTTVTATDKRRRQIFEGCMCFALPVVFMALHYIVQGHRFDIIEEYGCRPTTYFSIPSIFIVWLPPILMALGSLVFSGMALRHFFIRRITFAAHLASNSALSPSRYFRLMIMSILQMFWSLTIMIYTFWFTTLNLAFRPWTTWDDVHSDFGRIDRYPSNGTPTTVLRSFYFLWWMIPMSTGIFVVFFAFGRDAVEEYVRCFNWMRGRIFRQSVKRTNPYGSGSLPVFKSTPSPTLSTKSQTISTTDTLRHSPISTHPYPYPSRPPPKYIIDSSSSSSSSSSIYAPSEASEEEAYPSGSLHDLPNTPSTMAFSPTTPRFATNTTQNTTQTTRNVERDREGDGERERDVEPDDDDDDLPSIIDAYTTHPQPHPQTQPQTQTQGPLSPRPFSYPSLEAANRSMRDARF